MKLITVHDKTNSAYNNNINSDNLRKYLNGTFKRVSVCVKRHQNGEVIRYYGVSEDELKTLDKEIIQEVLTLSENDGIVTLDGNEIKPLTRAVTNDYLEYNGSCYNLEVVQ